MRVIVAGAAGKMGQEVLKAVEAAEGMEVVGAIDPFIQGESPKFKFFTTIEQAIAETNPDSVVDFTTPDVVKANLTTYLEAGLPAVVGTTGLTEEDVKNLSEKAKGKEWSCLIAPNFAIGAILMMKFAKEASEFFPAVEIIEYHHEQKKDAPSGTAIKTAEMIAENRKDAQQPQKGEEKISGARGGFYQEIPIHSVRLPGYVAHQEVIFGLPGQSLTIRHDSTHRESFMPGVILALRKVRQLSGVVYGLEHILFS